MTGSKLEQAVEEHVEGLDAGIIAEDSVWNEFPAISLDGLM